MQKKKGLPQVENLQDWRNAKKVLKAGCEGSAMRKTKAESMPE